MGTCYFIILEGGKYMPILPKNISKLNEPYCFNLVNSNDANLQQAGLEPLYITVYPQYINLEGHILYGGINHYECNLANDIARILRIMNSNTYGRFDDVCGFLNDDYPIRFKIYNHQIFFDDLASLSVYKNCSDIRNLINQKYHLKDDFYEPTREEIYQDYGWEYFHKNHHLYGTNIEYGHLNLTPQEQFNLLISSKMQELMPYTDPNDLTGNDLRKWLNYNANVFQNYTFSRKKKGVYNQEAMELINSLLETKRDVYNFFASFSKQTTDWQASIIQLLKEVGVYTEFKKQKPTVSDIFGGDLYAERSYWDSMFFRASWDILVQFIGLDKIETQLSKTITTSKSNIYKEFFNFLILDYQIVQIPRLIFDNSTGFKWVNPQEFNLGIDKELEDEVRLIKKYVPYNERDKYFK